MTVSLADQDMKPFSPLSLSLSPFSLSLSFFFSLSLSLPSLPCCFLRLCPSFQTFFFCFRSFLDNVMGDTYFPFLSNLNLLPYSSLSSFSLFIFSLSPSIHPLSLSLSFPSFTSVGRKRERKREVSRCHSLLIHDTINIQSGEEFSFQQLSIQLIFFSLSLLFLCIGFQWKNSFGMECKPNGRNVSPKGLLSSSLLLSFFLSLCQSPSTSQSQRN